MEQLKNRKGILIAIFIAVIAILFIGFKTLGGNNDAACHCLSVV